MFGGGFIEIGFFLFVAYLLFGPKKVPEIARTIGKGMAELRRASNELRNSLEEEIRNLDRVQENASNTSKASTYGHHDPEPTHEDAGSRS
jgi:sec-independent protein translocase protein TatA